VVGFCLRAGGSGSDPALGAKGEERGNQASWVLKGGKQGEGHLTKSIVRGGKKERFKRVCRKGEERKGGKKSTPVASVFPHFDGGRKNGFPANYNSKNPC